MKKYVVAVSGGVDSMVLLDVLISGRFSELASGSGLQITRNQLIVVHFDHGIREDSAEDERLVRGVAEKHGLAYETKRVELGADTSEDRARKERYKFLRQCCKKYDAQLMTAHHQDDVVETILINLIRGTGWRGLAPMAEIQNSNNQIIRPFINVTKADILAYAKVHSITWREDSTNQDTNYLRNYVRLQLIPTLKKQDSAALQQFISIYKNTTALKKEIATELQNHIIHYQDSKNKYSMPRYDSIMFPSSVSQEIIYEITTRLDPSWHPHALQIRRALHFVKTAHQGKKMNLTNNVQIECQKRMVTFQNTHIYDRVTGTEKEQ